ncbi:hypothetical protein LTR36_000232 [Oleoguttula mirabilis]|uniref:NmrA-like domain-containing protein n=1 Tax=Oleoguttula mirabilis TaxID=1507867 RepID=A0AAV9JXZ0_9PEZI|nr:hypothetical protein LTR36_000232 [Oleoguttula mirabilis]
MSLTKIAIFGASGQLGQRIVDALLECEKQTFNVLAVIPPGSLEPPVPAKQNYKCVQIDLLNASPDQLQKELNDVDAVVSAFNGKALDSQPMIQDAAASAGVKRFYPSEYGFHQLYRKPGSDWGYLHPLWDMKEQLIEKALHHPAIDSGRMSYTVIGCGDFYNQDREKIWCPWTQRDPDGGEYTLHVVGSPDAKADYTHIDDFASFLVATLREPAKSENAHLNYVSDTISNKEIAALLEKYTGKKAKFKTYSDDDQHSIVKQPDTAPKELQEGSAFPVDFWFLVKGAQGQGRFRRPKGEVHNHLFPDVKPTTFDDYLQKQHVDSVEWEEMHGPAR